MTPYLGQLLLASFNFAPKSFSMCNGQLLPINQNQALFSLLGTTYGGDGRTTFALPNLQGRTPISFGPDFVQGQRGGEESHTITQAETPAHTHSLQATTTSGDSGKPNGNLLATFGGSTIYTGAASLTAMDPATISAIGGSQPHENRQPFLVMNWVIALSGIFPSRN